MYRENCVTKDNYSLTILRLTIKVFYYNIIIIVIIILFSLLQQCHK